MVAKASEVLLFIVLICIVVIALFVLSVLIASLIGMWIRAIRELKEEKIQK